MNHILRGAVQSLLLFGSIVPVCAFASGDPAKSLFGWSDPAQSQIAPAGAGATIESPPAPAAEPTPTATNEESTAAQTDSVSQETGSSTDVTENATMATAAASSSDVSTATEAALPTPPSHSDTLQTEATASADQVEGVEPSAAAATEVTNEAATASTSPAAGTEALSEPAGAPGGGKDEEIATLATLPDNAAAPSSEADQSLAHEVSVVEITSPAAATEASSNVAAPPSVAIEEVTQEVTEAQ